MLEKRTSYKLTERHLEKLFTAHIKKTYGIAVELDVELNVDLWLPIELDIQKEDTQAFNKFWLDFQEDIHSLKDKHRDEDFELGDKLLQICLNHPTSKYIHDQDHVFVLVNENEKLVIDKEKGKRKVEEILQRITSFSIEEEDFLAVHTPNTTLKEMKIDKEDNTLSLTFDHKEDVSLTIWAYRDEKDKMIFAQTSYCHQDDIFEDMHEISRQVVCIVQEKLAVKDQELEVNDQITRVPFKCTNHKELTYLENAVLSLRGQGLDYQEIGDIVGKTKKNVDNTLQRIGLKEMDLYRSGQTPSFTFRGKPEHAMW